METRENRKTSKSGILANLITYHYYDNGKLKSVTDADGNVTSYQYDGNGLVKEQNNSDGTKDIYAYDVAGQLISQQVVKGDNVLSYINYTYDEAGNVVSKESSQQDGSVASISSVTMTYDKANRIKTYNGEKVTYDKEGNMTYGPSTEGMSNRIHLQLSESVDTGGQRNL